MRLDRVAVVEFPFACVLLFSGSSGNRPMQCPQGACQPSKNHNIGLNRKRA